MITINNYYREVEKIKLPSFLQEGHLFIDEVTQSGRSWELYHKNQIIKRVIELYIDRLNKLNMKKRGTGTNIEMRFIKRYIALDGKTKTKKEISDFIAAIKRSFDKKEISKKSNRIAQIQNELSRCYSLMSASIKILISKEKLTALKRELSDISIGKIYDAKGKLAPCKDVTYTDAVGKKGRCSYHKGVGEIFYKKSKKIKSKKLDKCNDKMYSDSYDSKGRCSYHGGSSSSLRGTDEKKKDELFIDINSIKPKDTFTLNGNLGKFLGNLERYKLAITLEGDQGAGKSQMAFILANAFAEQEMKVGFFSLEMGADSSLIERNRDKYLDIIHRDRIRITGEAPEGLLTVKQYASQFDVIIIDSWNKLDVDSIEFDNLRKEFPNTIWIVIFQRTTSKTIRGGTRPLYDAGINLEVVKVDNTFENNYAVASKNRYGLTGSKFNIWRQKIID